MKNPFCHFITRAIVPTFLVHITILLLPQKAIAQSQPNIIFILSDDIGYDLPTINGGESYSTPNIDSMARHGINFTHCEASPLCNPSRFMFLTGKYNFRNYSNWGYMSDSEKTIGNLMQDAGYTTGFFGKLQLTYNSATMKKWGWDTHLVFDLIEDTVAFRRYKNPVLIDNGYRIPDSEMVNKYCDDVLVQRIFDFIKNNGTKPFFVYYSMSLGHEPFSPTPDDAAFASWDPNTDSSDANFFPSMMHYMDKKVGAVLNKLRSAGLDQNTIVFFAGDNGTPPGIYYNAHGQTQIKGEKSNSTEGGTHVPLIAYWPGHIQPGIVNDDLIDFTDFFPTLADIAAYQDLSGYSPLDGLSFYRRLLGLPSKKKQQLFSHFDARPGGYDPLRRWVRNKTYKLYDSTEFQKSGKFYNVQKDPEELHELKESDLTASQLSLRENFKLILDTMGNWPACPLLTDAFVRKITSSSANIGGTIVNAGASRLIDRGSNITDGKKGPYLDINRLHDNTVQLGTFSEKRVGLLPQTHYRYAMYGMNNNTSHSTSYVQSTFYTLSQPPLRQPNFFGVASNDSTLTLKWTDAVFPKTGATQAGYLLVCSTTAAVMPERMNGNSPEQIVIDGNVIPLASTKLPKLPSKQIVLPAFNKNNARHFVLIPYTWDGANDSTYNYLVADARTVTIADAESVVATANGIKVSPNPAQTEFHVTLGNELSNKKTTINIFNATGKLLIKMDGIKKSQYVFGKNFPPGTYFATITADTDAFNFKLVKQ